MTIFLCLCLDVTTQTVIASVFINPQQQQQQQQQQKVVM